MAKPDGLTILTNPWDPIGVVTEAEGQRADFSKMPFIGGASEPTLSYVRRDILPGGLQTPADLVKVKNKFNFAGLRPSTRMDLQGRISLDLLGVPYTYVTGYAGGGAIFPAMQRGEVSWHNTSIQSYNSVYKGAIVDTGEAIPAWYYPFVNSKGELVYIDEFSGISSFDQVYQQVHGKPPAGIKWEAMKWMLGLGGVLTQTALAPPGTPEEAVAELRKGFYAAVNDPEYVAQFQKQFGIKPMFVELAEGRSIFESLARTDPAIVKFLKEYIAAVE